MRPSLAILALRPASGTIAPRPPVGSPPLSLRYSCEKDTTKPQPAAWLSRDRLAQRGQARMVFAIKAGTWLDTTTSIGFFPTPASVRRAQRLVDDCFTNTPGRLSDRRLSRYTFQFNGEITTSRASPRRDAVETMGRGREVGVGPGPPGLGPVLR
jgi:hypothetical protein